MKEKHTAATGTVCTPELFEYPAVKKRTVTASFTGGEVSSDGGITLLRQMDRRLGLTKALAQVLPDPRVPQRVEHSLLAMLRQRIYGLAAGYEDLNDHDTLRHDVAWQTAVERIQPLASSPTLCRLENRASREVAWNMHEVLLQQFIASQPQPPKELILDFDTTADQVHGAQAGAFFHAHYGDYCFLPLYVFCGEQLLVAALRPGNRRPARGSWAVLKFLVAALRAQWPKVKIVVRGDSGFARWRMLRWCEAHDVHYLIGFGKNSRLLAKSQRWINRAAKAFARTGQKQRIFGRIQYGAWSWDRPRRVLVKAEHTDQGSNPRFVVTNLEGAAQELYDEIYCARGEMENRIKEQQLGLFSDRTSCQSWWANQFRLLLSSFAYLLLERLRALALAGTELPRAQVYTIRLKLLKIGAVILRNSRRIRLLLSSSYPYQSLFSQATKVLHSG